VGEPNPHLRLALRPCTVADVGWITEACADPDIQRWTEVPTPYGADDARVFVASGAGSLLVCAVVDADTDEGLGMVAVHDVTDDGHLDAALGYWVASWARRRGVAVWATLAIAAEAAARWGVNRVSLDIAVANEASTAVARRAGFVPGVTPEGLRVADGDTRSEAVRWVREVG
jgi:RimJ/RimL family protein N-acetyltransferase